MLKYRYIDLAMKLRNGDLKCVVCNSFHQRAQLAVLLFSEGTVYFADSEISQTSLITK